ncbi:hypothetical protein ABVK25_010563 [Lepraria finkii]|uniref:3-beta hydroxysteroid dehydrogenase/isomerase domain-containing protein n=1 Tax=Lepraria finkii TaxID=1340010 RepID=A0ABR4AU44_9LECA
MASAVLTHPLGPYLVIGGSGLLVRTSFPTHVPNVEYHSQDITDLQGLRDKIIDIQPRVIFHLAYPGYAAEVSILRKTIIDGLKNVLQCAVESPKVEALVYTSTDQVVKKTGKELTEDDAEVWREDSNTYAYPKTKAIAETLVLAANGPELKTVSLRIPGIFGEGHCHFIDTNIERMRKGQQNMQIGNNTQLFNFVYVQNAAHAHLLALKGLFPSPDVANPPKVAGEAFFISDGEQIPFWDLCRKLWAAAGDHTPPEKIIVLPFWLLFILAAVGESFYWIFTLGSKQPELRTQDLEYLRTGCIFSIDKARTRLGYEILVDQDEGIRRSVKWSLEHERGETDGRKS